MHIHTDIHDTDTHTRYTHTHAHKADTHTQTHTTATAHIHTCTISSQLPTEGVQSMALTELLFIRPQVEGDVGAGQRDARLPVLEGVT